MCLYNTMALSLFGLVVSLLLEDNMVTVYGLTSGCIILGTTVNLILVLSSKVSFIPFFTLNGACILEHRHFDTKVRYCSTVLNIILLKSAIQELAFD